MIFRSLRWRVQRGHMIIMVLIGPLVIGIPYFRERHQSLDEADALLALSVAHTTTNEFLDGTELTEGRQGGQVWYYIYGRENEVLNQSANAPALELNPRDFAQDSYHWIEDHRILTIQRIDNGRAIIVGLHEQHIYKDSFGLLVVSVVALLVVITSGLSLTWWDAGNALKPLGHFANTARRISREQNLERIELEGVESELRELGEILNESFERMHYSLQQQRNFTADASHELRTPISIILLELESALRKERDAEAYRERIQSALETTEQLMHLVDSLLVLARSDASFTQLHTQEQDLSECCKEAVQLLEPKALEHNIAIQTECESIVITFDAERMRQVLINLINNALQYAGRGAKVCVRLEREGNNAQLSVSDDGPGIDTTNSEHIFDRFYRSDSARNRNQGNLGLGLSICKTIVEAHGGSIRYERQHPQGAGFIVSLPIATGPPLN